MPDIWESLEVVDLADLDPSLQLQTRVDRKYLVRRNDLAGVIASLNLAPKVIAINQVLRTNYSSIYFDTENLDFHKNAATRRRNRYKIRIRKYDETKDAFLELKFKTTRMMTEKVRIAVPYEQSVLLDSNLAWVENQLAMREFENLPQVQRSLTNAFKRRTLLLPSGSRFTVDSDLEFESYPAFNHDEWRIVETKSLGRKSELDSGLWRAGYRPIRVSKYSIGVALKHSTEPRNKWTIAIERAFRDGEYAKYFNHPA